MATKKKTGLIIGGIALAGIAVYLMTKKTTTVATTPAGIVPVSAPAGSSNLLTQGTSILSTLANLFKGSPAPGTAAAFVPVGIQPTGSTAVPSPAGGINYINPSSGTDLLNFLNPSAGGDTAYTPDTSGFTDIWSI